MIQDSRHTKADTQSKGRSRQDTDIIAPVTDSDIRFCKFVVKSAITRFGIEHPELSGIAVRAELRHAPGEGCDQILVVLYDRGGTRLGEYEVQGTRTLLSLRKVYRSPFDDSELSAALQLAEAKWPSNCHLAL